MPVQTLLIIDDERNVLYSLERGLQTDGLRILTSSTAQEGIAIAVKTSPDAILLDVRLPDLSGLDALERLRAQDRKVPVIIMTAHGTAETAIEAMKRGAFDYILKPWSLAELKELVHRALEAGRLSHVPVVLGASEAPAVAGDRIVGESPAMQDVFKEIGRVAGQDVNVLIVGESGTGKELVARAIYTHSRRREQAFLAINCAAIPESLLESELFGHEKGAFTGADRRRIGKFEQAHHGTLFLDEIGDMSPATQAKVLRILQDGRFERVGGNSTIESDVRIIAATNKDLDEAIRHKEFRQDLFYRLNTFTIRLPPLRERTSDIPQLTEHFLQLNRQRLGIEVQGVASEAMQVLLQHTWPGNVRELESAVRYAVVHATGNTIVPADLPASITRADVDRPSNGPPIKINAADGEIASSAHDLDEALRKLVRELSHAESGRLNDAVHAHVDRVLLEEVLRLVEGHQTRAAELLGISRTTLRAKLQQLGLTIERAVQQQ